MEKRRNKKGRKCLAMTTFYLKGTHHFSFLCLCLLGVKPLHTPAQWVLQLLSIHPTETGLEYVASHSLIAKANGQFSRPLLTFLYINIFWNVFLEIVAPLASVKRLNFSSLFYSKYLCSCSMCTPPKTESLIGRQDNVVPKSLDSEARSPELESWLHLLDQLLRFLVPWFCHIKKWGYY